MSSTPSCTARRLYPRSARAGINEPPIVSKPTLHTECGMFDGGPRGAHRGNGGHLALYHGIKDISRVPEINIRVTWT